MFKIIIAGIALSICAAGANAMPSFKSFAAARQVGCCQMACCDGSCCTSCEACCAACGGCCGK